MNESSIKYYIYQTKEVKFYEEVLKNLHHAILSELITQEHTTLGYYFLFIYLTPFFQQLQRNESTSIMFCVQ